jgi:hypothetical protein
VIIAALAFKLGSGSATSANRASATATPTPAATATPLPVTDLYRQLAPSVVLITTSKGSLGSGVIVTDTGTVLTAHHVVSGGGDISILFADGTKTSGTIAAAYPKIDIATLTPKRRPEVVEATLGGGVAVGSDVVAALPPRTRWTRLIPTLGVDAESAQRSGYAADVIVVLTDGANTHGVEPATAAESAAVRGLRVFTIGFGTTTPSRMACTGRQAGGWAGGPGGGFGGGGGRNPRVMDEGTLQAVADITGGQYYKAESADQLQGALGDLPSQVAVVRKHLDIASWFAGAGGLLVAVAVGLSLWWNRVRAPR